MTPLETIIQAGRIFDGTGAPSQMLDIGLAGNRIVAIESPGSLRAENIIDAAGRWVCPGFIDTHTHSDTYLLLEPDAPSKIMQGIVTEVIGNCGSSAAPLYGVRRLPSDWKAKTYPAHWSSLGDYRHLIETSPCAVNVLALVGHNTLRASVMGNLARAARPDEQRAMEALLRRCLEGGAWGLSTGLLYIPGKWATPAEVEGLAAVTAAAGGIYATHMRNEGDSMLEALNETLWVARKTGVRLQISHIKVSGHGRAAMAEKALEILQAARVDGVDVAADKYPYEASCTDLDILLPDEAIRDGNAATLQRLRSPSERRQLAAAIAAAHAPGDWDRIIIGSTFHPDTRRFQGMPLLEVSRSLALSPVDTVLFLIERDELKTSAFFNSMSADVNRALFAADFVMIGSDASLRAPWGILGREHPHPRAYGAFPRFFRLAIDHFQWTPEKTIHRMTGLPAAHFGIQNRGILRIGHYADIIVLDPDHFMDRATYTDPQQFAGGIDHLLVNGVAVITNGKMTRRRPGRWLERARP